MQQYLFIYLFITDCDYKTFDNKLKTYKICIIQRYFSKSSPIESIEINKDSVR